MKNFPTVLTQKKDSNWKYRTNYEEVNGDYKEVAVGVKPVIKKINRYVVGGFRPTWEIEKAENHSVNEHVISVNLQLDDESPKQKKTSKAKRKRGSSSSIWWIIGVIVVLYLLFK